MKTPEIRGAVSGSNLFLFPTSTPGEPSFGSAAPPRRPCCGGGRWRRLSLTASLAIQVGLGLAAEPNFEGKQTNPVRVSPDGTRLFAVNTPAARLSVFDVSNRANPVLIAEIPVGLEPVSVNPLSGNEAWVVNEVSDSVSVVSVSHGIVTDTLPVKDEPADVVFAHGRAFVTAGRRNEIHVFDLATHTNLAVIPVLGQNPRALVVSADGTRVYAAFALSGNRTTIIPPASAPPQPPPTRITNAPPQVGLIVDAADPAWSSVIQYTMPDNDVVEIDTAALAVTRYFSGVGTVNLGLAVRPGNGDLFVANTDARNRVRFEPNVRGHVVLNRLSRVAQSDGVVAAFDLNPGLDYSVLPNPDALATALAQPTAVVFDPSGDFAFVAAFGTDRVARVRSDGTVLSRIEVGPATGTQANPRTKRGPRGLALHPDGSHLYVLNRIANTLSVIATANDSVVRELPVGSHDPTPTAIREGRGFLYDAKLSGNGTMSCASCHVDAEMDLLAWDLGNPDGVMETARVTLEDNSMANRLRHPMKGPMTTQTLRGLSGNDPLHWRGDRTNFLHFNGAFASLLGGSPLSLADMSAYRAFINTLALPPNPNQKLDRSLPASLAGGNPAAGRSFFLSTPVMAPGIECAACHAGAAGTGPEIIDAAHLKQSQALKAPHLRNVYQKLAFSTALGAVNLSGFGLTHDGSDGGLAAHFSIERFLPVLRNSEAKKLDLAAYLMCFDTGTAPAVGYARTLDARNVTSPAVVDEWTLLEKQPATSINLIAKGTLNGARHGLRFNAGTKLYESDTSGLGPFTRDDLIAKIAAGDTITVMGVPPGTGIRLGVDRDTDGVFDGDEIPPLLTAQPTEAGLTLTWPANATGFVLESTTEAAGSVWQPETRQRATDAEQFTVTVPFSDELRLFRLRGL